MKNILLILLLYIIPTLALGQEKNKTITLNSDNFVALRDAVTWSSISKLQQDLLSLSAKLDDDEPIYLVLDTPGGSVMAGQRFIETVKGIPQPVHAVVLFAASMGFQITQAVDNRYNTKEDTTCFNLLQNNKDEFFYQYVKTGMFD